jgi:adenine specific DNA methylase Mod
MLGVEPKRPKKFLEGKESSQMKEILGKGYGPEDWYEGEPPLGNDYATSKSTTDETKSTPEGATKHTESHE